LSGNNEPLRKENEPLRLEKHEFEVLSLIKKNPKITKEQIATTTGKSRATITRTIKSLIEKEIILRELLENPPI
jgi:predicted HTH transcriptional regulator